MTMDEYFADKIRLLDQHIPGWRDLKHPGGQLKFSPEGTLLDENGDRSIFDDVDE